MQEKVISELKKKLSILLPEMNERQKRLLAGAEAKALGYGGVKALAKITGMSPNTIRKGLEELGSDKIFNVERSRKAGGGRKKSTYLFPHLKKALEEIIEPETRGDPESLLRWTCKSVRNIAFALEKEGIQVSHHTVTNLLHEMEYSLKANKKTKEGSSHPDRNEQFHYINKIAKLFLKQKSPVISVDTKKKELLGNFKNNGQEWSSKGKNVEVNSHDFSTPGTPRAIPYGVYDINENKGWVNVGVSSDTAQFAVESIKQWWKTVGKKRYVNAKKLLIFPDAGGSNGYRLRLWKLELQSFCDKEKIEITVCHFPPGTSKWNKIEHRLFSFVRACDKITLHI